jgi:hypothetical protein
MMIIIWWRCCFFHVSRGRAPSLTSVIRVLAGLVDRLHKTAVYIFQFNGSKKLFPWLIDPNNDVVDFSDHLIKDLPGNEAIIRQSLTRYTQ